MERCLRPAFFLLLGMLLAGWVLPPRDSAAAHLPEAMQVDLFQAQMRIRACRAHPTFDDWESCWNELLYLVQCGDPEAQEFALRVLPRMAEVDCNYRDEINQLAQAAHGMPDEIQPILASMPVADQLFVFRVYNRLCPADWLSGGDWVGDRDWYLAHNPGLAAAFQAWQQQQRQQTAGR